MNVAEANMKPMYGKGADKKEPFWAELFNSLTCENYIGEVSKYNTAGYAYSSLVIEIKGRRWREKYLFDPENTVMDFEETESLRTVIYCTGRQIASYV